MHAFPMQNKVHMQTAALAEAGFDTKTESSPDELRELDLSNLRERPPTAEQIFRL